MCRTVDLQLLLRYEPHSDSIHLVSAVPSDDGSWEPVIDESLPSSKALSRVQLLCALHVAIAREAEAGSTAAT